MILAAYIKTLRPIASSSCALVGVAAYSASADSFFWFDALMLFLTIGVTCAFGFILNDYVDIEKDMIDHSTRPMVDGTIPQHTVIPVLITLVIIALLAAFLIDLKSLGITALAIFILTIYGRVNNRYGFAANVLVASLCILTVFYGMSVGNWDQIIFGVGIILFFFVLGREILLDTLDIKGDSLVNKTSIPIKLGVTMSVKVAALLFLIATLVSIYIGTVNQNIFYILFIVLGVNSILWFYTIKCLKDARREVIIDFLMGTKWIFLLGILGLATSQVVL